MKMFMGKNAFTLFNEASRVGKYSIADGQSDFITFSYWLESRYKLK